MVNRNNDDKKNRPTNNDKQKQANQAKVDSLSEEAARLKRQLDSAQVRNKILFLLSMINDFYLHAVYSFVESVIGLGHLFLNVNTRGLSLRCSFEKGVLYALTLQIISTGEYN